ncbi:MAG: MoaD family protein [Coriobacteriales bacterium]|jgi:molybdopterin synthase sulfur carrier subunit|nr:MoaD family protein [Coriobacteriales bacterium]
MLVKYYAYYRDHTGRKDEQLPAPGTVGDLLRLLAKRYGKKVEEGLLAPGGLDLGPDAIVLVNGRNIAHLNMLDTPLTDTDAVTIFPLVAGG